MKKIIIVIVLIISSNIFLYSASSYLPSLGYYSSFLLNYDRTDLKKLPDVPNCCPLFSQGFGYGYNMGGLINYPLKDKLQFQFAFGFSKFQDELKANEKLLINFNGEAINAEAEHYIKANFRTFDFNVFLNYNLISSFNMGVGFGISKLINKRYYQKETLIEPKDRGVFSDTKTRVRNVYSGIIHSTNSFIPFISTQFSYDLPMNISSDIILSPQLFIKIPLGSYLENSKWESYTMGIGMALKFQSNYEAVKIFHKEYYQIDTMYFETEDKFTAGFKKGLEEINLDTFDLDRAIVYYKEVNRVDTIFHYVFTSYNIDCGARVLSDNPLDSNLIQVQKHTTTNMVPLLNYVFFSENSYQIPKRYKLLNKKDISKFSFNLLYNSSTLDVYYNILNIIALRMKQNPSIKIKLIGCNSNYDLEENNLNLSKKRAESVADYLIKQWGINSDRIKIDYRNLPQEPSTTTESEGQEENRRVEIVSENAEILRPLVIKFSYKSVSPTVIRFYFENVPKDVDYWLFEVSSKSKILKKYSGKDDNTYLLDWVLFDKDVKDFGDSLAYQLIISKNGKEYKSKKHYIYVRIFDKKYKKASKKRIYNYQLILFKYNQAELMERSLKTLEFIKNQIRHYSNISISGYSDKLGDEQYNKNLSLKRAENVAKELGIKNATINAYGENSDLFDNNLPEGRFYSRTVNIEVVK